MFVFGNSLPLSGEGSGMGESERTTGQLCPLSIMKLLMISGDRSLSSGKRGAFWYTLELLRTHFERIDVVCPRGSPADVPSPFDNVFVHPSPWPLLWQPLWIRRKGKELIAAHHHDVMTVHEFPPFYNGVGARLLARDTGIHYALEIHHVVGLPIASSVAEWIGRTLSRAFLPWDAKRATKVRTVNRSVRSMLMRWGIPGSIIDVVPSFYIDPEALEPDWFLPKTYDFVFCARLVANKGLRQTIDALRWVDGATLLVVGDGPLRARYERYARRKGLASRVTFAGWLPSQEDVKRALHSAKIFLMNSRSEGGPRIALEAMGCGLPVIATPVGIMPEVIKNGENGFLVPFRTGALVQVMRQLQTDGALRGRLGKAAAASVASFDRKEAIARYAAFLSSLASHA